MAYKGAAANRRPASPLDALRQFGRATTAEGAARPRGPMAGADGGAAWDRIPARPQASLRVAEFSLTPASSSLEAGVATSRARPKLERLATADSSDSLPESCTIRLAFGNSDAPSGRSLGGIGFSWRKAFIVAYFRRTILRRCSIRAQCSPCTPRTVGRSSLRKSQLLYEPAPRTNYRPARVGAGRHTLVLAHRPTRAGEVP